MPYPVYLVRHGQSEWNVRRLTQGQTAHPQLTALGRQQAAAAASLIAGDLQRIGAGTPAVVSSDLTRAVQTAQIIADRLGGALTYDERLREQALGELEGRSYDETWSVAADFDWTDPAQALPGGESVLAVHDRVAAVLDGLRPDAPTVLVSHGEAIRVAVAHLRGMKPQDSQWVPVANGAVARIDSGLVGSGAATRARVIEWLGE